MLVAYMLCGAYMFVNSMITGFEGALLAMGLYGFVWVLSQGPVQHLPLNLSMKIKGVLP